MSICSSSNVIDQFFLESQTSSSWIDWYWLMAGDVNTSWHNFWYEFHIFNGYGTYLDGLKTITNHKMKVKSFQRPVSLYPNIFNPSKKHGQRHRAKKKAKVKMFPQLPTNFAPSFIIMKYRKRNEIQIMLENPFAISFVCEWFCR